jgi:hypothetical protein
MSLQQLIGKRVLLKGKHPWAGETGTIEREDKTPVGYGLRVNLDNGMSCFVFKMNEFKVL